MKTHVSAPWVLGYLMFQSLQVSATDKEAKPNIVLIMTDQQSYNTISALQNTYTSTPNIDRLVKSGISFTNTMCANPVSVPSRFSIFTGRYGGEFNIRENRCPDAHETDVKKVLTQTGMGNIFKRSGYETVYSGKVHLPFANGKNKFSAPVNYGFDNFLTKDERDDLSETASNFIRKRKTKTPLLLVVSFINPHDICLESSTNLSETVKEDFQKPEVAATISKIREKAATYDSAYFYGQLVPSLPLNFDLTKGFPRSFKPSLFDDFPTHYWQKYRWTYAQLVSMVDSQIGRVLDAIDQWSEKENTIIIFTSDHGEMQGAHHSTTKNLPYNECQHVPFIIAGKGIRCNVKDHSLLCNGTDIIPTMCELAGIEIPSQLSGLSVAQKATGKAEVPQRNYLYLEGDGFSQIIENGVYKYTRFMLKNGKDQMLIDLKKDSGELTNVSNDGNTYKKKAAELEKRLYDITKVQPQQVHAKRDTKNEEKNVIKKNTEQKQLMRQIRKKDMNFR